MKLSELFYLFILAVLVYCLIRVTSARGQDPEPPALTPARLAGTWRLAWGTDTYTITFAPRGRYRCSPGGYRGSWRIHRGRLHLSECRPDPSAPVVQVHEYELRLSPTLRGCCGTTRVRLQRVQAEQLPQPRKE